LLGIALGGEPQVGDHRVDVVFEFGDFAAGIHLNGACEVALGDRGGDVGNRADLVGEVCGEQVDVAGEVFPSAGGTGDVGLTAETAFDSDFAGHASDLLGEDCERISHVVDGLGQSGDFTLGLDGKRLLQVAGGHG